MTTALAKYTRRARHAVQCDIRQWRKLWQHVSHLGVRFCTNTGLNSCFKLYITTRNLMTAFLHCSI